MSLSDRIRRVKRRQGILAVLRKAIPFGYNRFIRPHLPANGPVPTMNGVPVANQWGPSDRQPRLFDGLVPWRTPVIEDNPQYENALIEALQSQVRRGDSVIVVGGGTGISSVIAANQTGPDGSVLIFEGSDRRAQTVQNTLLLNNVDERCEVRNKIVGAAYDVRGASKSGFDPVEPDSLPHCDVLELDCEGAEFDILRNLTIRPRVIIAEIHPEYDSPAETISSILESLGYDVVTQRNVPEAPDVSVLTASRSDSE